MHRDRECRIRDKLRMNSPCGQHTVLVNKIQHDRQTGRYARSQILRQVVDQKSAIALRSVCPQGQIATARRPGRFSQFIQWKRSLQGPAIQPRIELQRLVIDTDGMKHVAALTDNVSAIIRDEPRILGHIDSPCRSHIDRIMIVIGPHEP